ncbi:hypothetical protein BH11CYA1_BH11CYA1_20540 [soil metagenome]
MDGHDGGHGGGDLGVGHGHGVDLGFGSHDGGISHGFDHDGNHAGHVTAEAMMVAHSHCHSHDGMVGHFGNDVNMGDLSHGHIGGWSHGEGIDPAKAQRIKRMLSAVEKAKTDPERRYYGAHIVGHGFIEVPAVFRNAALAAGMLRICNTVANFNPVDLTDTQISDWSRFSPPYSRTNTPAGFYPGAAGLTRVFKQYWQVTEPGRWWVWGEKAKFDRTKSTYIEVSIVTWFFADIGDYETRIDINVVSLPMLDRTDKVWARKRTPLVAHQLAAEKVCHRLFEALKATPPGAYVLSKRSKIIDQKAEEARREEARKQPHLPKVGQSGADLDSLFGATDPLEPATAAAPVKGSATAVTPPSATVPAATVPAVPAVDEKLVPVEVTIPAPRMKKPEQDA